MARGRMSRNSCWRGNDIRDLYRTRTACRASVRAREPAAQLSGGFLRGRAIKGHQGRWHPRDAHDVRAPAVLRDGSDLDEVQTPPDGFFETMNRGGHSVERSAGCWSDAILRCPRRRSSEAKREDVCTGVATAAFFGVVGREKVALSIAAQAMHGSSTAFQQSGSQRRSASNRRDPRGGRRGSSLCA
jgi:hypothetical protein